MLSDDEIIRIYDKRWDIEVFFKSAKSMLALAKEFQGRSYDMMTAHTSIVFMRYIMLALEARNSCDKRTVGEFFYQACEELVDIRFSASMLFLLDILKQILSGFSVLSETAANEIMNLFFSSLPSVWSGKLKFSAYTY